MRDKIYNCQTCINFSVLLGMLVTFYLNLNRKEDKNPTHGINNGRNIGWDQDSRQRGWYPETVKRALGALRDRSTVRSLTRAVGGVK